VGQTDDRLRELQRAVGDRLDFLAGTVGDLAGLPVEEADDAPPAGPSRQGDYVLNLDRKVDVPIGRLARADALQPILGMDNLVFGLQTSQADRLGFVGLVTLRI